IPSDSQRFRCTGSHGCPGRVGLRPRPGWCAAERCGHGPEKTGQHPLDGYSGPFRAHPRSCHTPSLPFEHMCADGLLQGLNPAQQQAVTSDASPLCILAGAGSGKTRVLTRRIAWRVDQGTADPRHVLALTFTRKAAGELSGRLSALGVRDRVAAGTFHAIAYAQLRRRWADRSERPPTLLDRKVRLLAPLLAGHRRAGVQPADVATEIEWAKARFVGPAHYETEAVAAGRKPALPLSVMASLFERYEEEKRRRGVVDFDDLLLLCARALATDPQFAAGQPWPFRQ